MLNWNSTASRTILRRISNKVLHTPLRCYSSKYLEEGSLYIHWPYCKQRCSYCNFVKFVPREHTSWTFEDEVIEDALVHEIGSVLQETPIKNLVSVYFGGGTPSLSRPRMVERVLEEASKHVGFASDIEVTLEANPTSAEAAKLRDFKFSGANRLSLGVQSLRDDVLRILNRDHSSENALACLEEARRVFPGRVSTDLMFRLPNQSLADWKEDLELMMSLADQHMSLYQLTLERGTPLFKQYDTSDLRPQNNDVEAEMYETAVSLLSKAGFRRYEVSNFALNHSSESVHNKAVWQGGQYIGVGPGAHSRIVTESGLASGAPREARVNAADPRSWLREVRSKGSGCRRVVSQTWFDIRMEYICTALRTIDGVIPEKWAEFCDLPIETVFPADSLDSELIIYEDGRLRATEVGLNVLDSFLPSLILRLEEINCKLSC